MAGLPKAGQKTISLAEWKRFTQVADWWDRTHGTKPPSVLPPKGQFVGFQFSNNLNPRVVLDSSWYTLPILTQDGSPTYWAVPNAAGFTANETDDDFTCKISGWYRVTLILHVNHYTARGTQVRFWLTPVVGSPTSNGGAYVLHPPYGIDEADLSGGYITWGRLIDEVYCTRWIAFRDDDKIKFQAANYGNYYPNGNGNQNEAYFYSIEFERLASLV